MKNDKLGILLSTFSPEEWTDFGKKFLHRPAYSGQTQLLSLYEMIRNHYKKKKDTPDKFPTKAALYLRLFKNEVDNSKDKKKEKAVTTDEIKTLSNRLSMLNKWAEDFLLERYYEENPRIRQVHLLDMFNRRSASKHVKSTLTTLKKQGDNGQKNKLPKSSKDPKSKPQKNKTEEGQEQQSTPPKGYYADVLYQEFRIAAETYRFTAPTKRTETQMMDILQKLDNFYLFNRLKYFNLWQNDQLTASKKKHAKRVQASDKDLLNIPLPLYVKDIVQMNSSNWMKFLRNFTQNATPGMYCEYLIERMNQHPKGNGHFTKLTRLLTSDPSYQQLPKTYLKNMYEYLVNFCLKRISPAKDNEKQQVLADDIKKASLDKKLFKQHLYDLYQEMIAKGLLLERDDSLNYKHYEYIYTLAFLGFGDVEKAKKFIEAYKKYVPIGYRTNYYHYGRAKYYAYHKDWESASKELDKVKGSFFTFVLKIKKLHIKQAYATDPLLETVEAIRKFRRFLNRHKTQIDPVTLDSYKQMLTFVSKLSKTNPADLNGSKAKVKKEAKTLKKRIVKAYNVALKNWLLEQVDIKIAKGE